VMNALLLFPIVILCGCSSMTTKKGPKKESQEPIVTYHTPQVVYREKSATINTNWRDKVKKSPVAQKVVNENPEIVPVIEEEYKPWVFFWVSVVALGATVYLMFFRQKKRQ